MANSLCKETRQKLLDSAGQVFAEKGFRAATVRDICGIAGINIAAVNYYFGDKEKLYVAVMEHFFEQALRQYPPDGALAENASPEQRLRAFIRSFLWRLLGPGKPEWHGKMILREVAKPTGLISPFVEKAIRPQFMLLASILRHFLPKATDEQLRLTAQSIVGQCIFHRFSQPIAAVLFPDHKYGAQEIEAAAEHIARFSLAALKGLAAEYAGQSVC